MSDVDALAERIREVLAGELAVTEQRMFGGVSFLVRGHMAVAASGQGGLLVRADPAESDSIVARSNATPMEMRGRPMRGWLRVAPEDVRTKRQLGRWVAMGVASTRSLPPKAPRSASRRGGAAADSAPRRQRAAR